MKRLERLTAAAKKLNRERDDLFIIEYEDREWKIGELAFPDLESAKKYIAEKTGDRNVHIIINDSGCYVKEDEPEGDEYGADQIEDKEPHRDPPDAYESDEHGSERPDRHKECKYNHTWV